MRDNRFGNRERNLVSLLYPEDTEVANYFSFDREEFEEVLARSGVAMDLKVEVGGGSFEPVRSLYHYHKQMPITVEVANSEIGLSDDYLPDYFHVFREETALAKREIQSGEMLRSQWERMFSKALKGGNRLQPLGFTKIREPGSGEKTRSRQLTCASPDAPVTCASPDAGGVIRVQGEAKEAFDAAKDLNTIEAYRVVIDHFPGFYAALARQRIKELEEERERQRAKELEEERERQRAKELEEERERQRAKELEEERERQRAKELEEERERQRAKELEEEREGREPRNLRRNANGREPRHGAPGGNWWATGILSGALCSARTDGRSPADRMTIRCACGRRRAVKNCG